MGVRVVFSEVDACLFRKDGEGKLSESALNVKPFAVAVEVDLRAVGKKHFVRFSPVVLFTDNTVDLNAGKVFLNKGLCRSGQAVVTTAVGAKGAEETAVRQVRELENDDLFNQSTVQKRGTVIAPDMSLSGEIVQQQRRSGRTEESYFFIHMVLTDLATGLAVWEDNVEIAKQGTKSIFD